MIRKYPRTRHLQGSRLQAGDQDLEAAFVSELENGLVVDSLVELVVTRARKIEELVAMLARGKELAGDDAMTTPSGRPARHRKDR